MNTRTRCISTLAAAALLPLVLSFNSPAANAETADGKDEVRSAQDPVLPDGVELVADQVYATRGERELRLNVYRPKFSKGPFPAVVLIHGGWPGSKDRHQYDGLAASLAGQGLVAVSIEYRTAVDASYPAAIEDARSAVRWLEDNAEEHRVRPGSIAALGEGFGGYVAAMLGVVSDGSDAPTVNAVVAIHSPLDLPRFNPTGPPAYPYRLHMFFRYPRAQRPDLWKQASPLELVDSRSASFLLFHAKNPVRVALEQSKAMERALTEAGVDVNLVSPDGTGEDIISAPQDVARFSRSVANYLKRVLWRLPDGVKLRKDLVYASPGGRDLRLDLYSPKHATGPLPAVLVIHGGGWAWGGKDDFSRTAAYLAERGFVAACVEYRLSRERIYPAAVDDVKAAVRWLRANAEAYGIDAGRIGAFGSSAGAHLAAMLAVTPDINYFAEGENSPGVSVEIQAAVPMSAPVDMVAQDGRDPFSIRIFMGGRPHEDPELWRQASPTFFAEKSSCAFLFLQGTEDDLTPFSEVEVMRQKLIRAGIRAEMFIATGGGHDFYHEPQFRDAALERMAGFFEEELGRGRSAPEGGRVHE